MSDIIKLIELVEECLQRLENLESAVGSLEVVIEDLKENIENDLETGELEDYTDCEDEPWE